MNSASPPSLPSAAAPKSWLERNWLWLLVAVSALGAALCLGVVLFILGLLKSSDAYQGALTRLKASPAVQEALGVPVQEAWYFTGNIHLTDSSGHADLVIPLSGPRGKASASVLATKSAGVWRFDQLVVTVAANGRRIDLSDTVPPAPAAPASDPSPAVESPSPAR